VSTFQQRIISEALLGGLPGDAEPACDLGPGPAVLAGAGDGRGEVVLGLADSGVGLGDPVKDVECRAWLQWPGHGAFADGGAGLGARSA
jgi:hypothetical protein